MSSASIKDVAKLAGVAVSTVSKVLNGYSGVSEDTRRKVQAAVEELNFVPNAIASALSSKQSGRVALLLNMNLQTSAGDEITMQRISGGINKAQQLGMEIITVFYSMLENRTVEEMIRYFKTQSIEGIVIYGMTEKDRNLQKLAESGEFKIVLVDAPFTGPNISSVGVDHEQAQIDVARATIEGNNVQSILYIAGDGDSYPSRQRLIGMEKLSAKLRMPMMVQYGSFSEKKARELTFEYGRDKDVIVCSSDLMAIGAMRALIEMDVFHPVCGFDGLILMGYAGKQMNTIRQDFAGVSAAAVEEIKRLLSGEPGRRVITPHSIVRMKYTDIIC